MTVAGNCLDNDCVRLPDPRRRRKSYVVHLGEEPRKIFKIASQYFSDIDLPWPPAGHSRIASNLRHQ